MSTTAQNTIDLNVASGEIRLTLDWDALGEAFAEESSDEQMNFLIGMRRGFNRIKREGGSPLLQLHYIAHTFEREAPELARDVANYLDDLADRLRAVDPEAVAA